MLYHSLLAEVSAEEVANRLMGLCLYTTNCFSLAAFIILFILNFYHFNCVSWCVSFWFHLVWNSWASWTLGKSVFLPQIREVLQPLFLQVTFLSLSLPLLLLAPLYMNIFCLMSQRSLSLSSLKFFFFFPFCGSVWVSPIVFSSSLPIHSLASFNLLLSPCSVFFSSLITYVWYFLILMSLC